MPKWRTHAACRGTDPALFYDPHPASVAAAKTVCDTCPVRNACRAHAVDTGSSRRVGRTRRRRTACTVTRHHAGTRPGTQDQRRRFYDLFYDADPDQAALDQLLAHIWLPTPPLHRAATRRALASWNTAPRLYPVRR